MLNFSFIVTGKQSDFDEFPVLKQLKIIANVRLMCSKREKLESAYFLK